MVRYFYLLFFSCSLSALPQGMIANGNQVELKITSPEVMEILTGDQAIIGWSDFSIETQETVRFIQPHSNAVVLNRVLEANPSRLMGRLESNGAVLLINPNGILVDRTAQIHTGSFIASTLDLQNECFLANKEWKFSGESRASIENYGHIETDFGSIAFLGRQTENHGSMVAKSSAALIGGNGAVVRFDPTMPFYIRTKGENHLQKGFSLSVNGGSIRAADAYLFGDRIWLQNESVIDVSGPNYAGTVLIGGDMSGKSEHYRNAEYLVCEAGAFIKADSLLEGKGGSLHGDGGFIEVSAPMLSFDGIAELNAVNGKSGLLYLDPTDIIIGAALCGTAVVGCPTNWTVACGCPVNISAASIAAALAGGDVCINTVTAPDLGCAGNGNITVNTGFTWASANNLLLTANNGITVSAGANITPSGAGDITLRAPTITISANIQNSDVGDIILDATNAITINGSPVSVGSRNGTTMIGNPATARCNRNRPNVTLNAAAGANSMTTRLGFLGTAGTGPIDVTCGALDISARVSNAIIGHGAQNVALNINGPITVDASGQIHLHARGGNLQAGIGHGDQRMAAGSTVQGNICVATQADVLLDFDLGAANTTIAKIGHGGNLVTGSVANLSGDVSVFANTGITLTANRPPSIVTTIGHFSGSAAAPTSVSGNIDVASRGNIVLSTSALQQRSTIGHFTNAAGNLLPDLTTNINVITPGNIVITGAGVIGSVTSETAFIGNLNVLAGGNITITSQFVNSHIGFARSSIFPILTNGNASTTVSVSGNLVISNIGAVSTRILAPGNVRVHVQGNITVQNGALGFISTTNTNAIGLTQIWTGGALTNQSGTFFFGSQTAAAQSSAIDLQVGGALTYVPSTFATLAQPFTLISPRQFAAGELFLGQSMISCTTCQPLITAGASIANVPVNTAVNNFDNLTITTTSGDIAVSALLDGDCPEAAANLLIGAIPANNINLTTTTGRIVLTDYNNFEINRVLTTGSNSLAPNDAIFIHACNDVTINGAASVAVTGAGSIQLTAEHDINVNGLATSISTTTGPISLNANNNIFLSNSITSVDGDILIQAGTAVGCLIANHSIDLIAGTVSTATGDITINADANLTLSSLNSLDAPAGSIRTLAGGNTNLNNTTVSAGGIEILMISGRSMNMVDSQIVAPLTSIVTLVVDNCFPSMPFIGSGAFSMDATSTIDGDPRIFTAMRPLNTIFGLINGQPFVPGTLFINTDLEIWCQYFAFPFPYPLPTLGLPYTIIYKNCLQEATFQAQIIVTEALLDLHPTNEFPGWLSEFFIMYQTPQYVIESSQPFYIRRRNLNILNHPKSWTVWINN
jgi:filamentous hemagglutinin family protein